MSRAPDPLVVIGDVHGCATELMALLDRIDPTPETTVASSLLGKRGLVTREIEPGNLRGKVMIENDTWSATAETVIPVGTKVVVKSSEGVHVKVEELGE